MLSLYFNNVFFDITSF